MAEGTGTVICKLCDEPLKVVKTQDGKAFLGCECPDKKYLMENVDRLLRLGELDAVEFDSDDGPGDEDDYFDDDEYDDEDDEEEEEEDEEEEEGDAEKNNKPKGPSGSQK